MKQSVKILVLGVVAIVVLFGLIQLIPYGQNHTNPPVVQEPPWPDTATRALAVRACFDCHSNQTNWNVWSNIAPFSWVIQHDVEGGRRTLNFSEWTGSQRGAREMARSVQNGSMPRWFYLPIHPEANLTAAERQQLINGLQTIGGGASGGSGD